MHLIGYNYVYFGEKPDIFEWFIRSESISLNRLYHGTVQDPYY